MIEDKTGQPRSEQELIEARDVISKQLINPFEFDPILVQYPTIIDAINELLERRKNEKSRN